MGTVTILMSTYNGECYIEEQLESIFKQSYKGKIKIIIRDDGSTDNTLEKIEKWKEKLDIKLIADKNIGVINSFLELTKIANESDYYAFCDQDDIWKTDKIQRAVDILRKQPNVKQPLLYFSNADYVDKNASSMDKKLYNSMPNYSLASAIMSNPCLGCTMLFNDKLMEVVKKAKNNDTTMHDKFIFLMALVSGFVIYDEKSMLLYRQHENNVMGRKKNIAKSMRQRYKLWIKANGCSIDKQAQAILDNLGNNISDDNKIVLNRIVNYKLSFINRFNIILDKKNFSTGIKRIDRSFRLRVLLGLA